jgi:acetyltransferase-like isoleucine patch superfamily enzyme
MKNVVQKCIQFRNPKFVFDTAITGIALCAIIWTHFWVLFRGLKWFLYLKKPKMSMLGKRVSVFNSPQVKFGKFLKLGNDVHLHALGKEGIIIGHNVGIGAFSRIVVSSSMNNIGTFVKIGNNVGIGEYAYLGGAGGLKIGDDCIIGQYFSCHPENHVVTNIHMEIRHQGVTRKGISIGKNCWIGSKVTILDGVEIGEGCIVAAGAVVTKSFPENSIIGGVPAKLLKSRL